MRKYRYKSSEITVWTKQTIDTININQMVVSPKGGVSVLFRRYFVVLKPDDKDYTINGKPEGFIRVERTESKGRMMINISGLKPPEDFSYQGILLGVKDGKSTLIKMGELKVDERGRNLSQWLFDPENVAGTGLKLNNIKVYAIAVDSLDNKIKTPLVGSNDDLPEHWKENIESLLKSNTISKKEKSNIELPKSEEKNTKEKEPQEQNETKELSVENEINKAEKIIKSAANSVKTHISTIEKGVKTETEDLNIEKPDVTKDKNDEEIIKHEDLQVPGEIWTDKSSDENIEIEDKTESNNTKTYESQSMNDIFEIDGAGNVGNENYITGLKEYINSITRHLNTVEPFDEDMKNYKWWKLETGSGLMKSHYLMGLCYNEKGKVKYIVYAMPGKFNRLEQPYSGMTGFVSFRPLKGQTLQYNADGYWLMHIDALTGQIATPMKSTPPPLFDSDFL